MSFFTVFHHSIGMTEEQFLSLMSSKMAAQDRDEEIRQIFMTFDTLCESRSLGFRELIQVPK